MSSLSPRDIQTRIRSGASLEDVAREAELPVEKVEPFAAPVLAEREHVAGTALQCPVRRRGETGSVRAMRAVLGEKLHGTGLSVDDLDWDAWRNEDRRWTVVGRYQNDGVRHEALFVFDQRARFSVAVNDQARELIGEAVPETSRTLPATEAAGSDTEPTINLDDELAIVRALQDRRTRQAASDVQALTQPAAEPSRDARPAEPEPEPVEDEEEPEDYAPAEFQEVDGLYDFVPKNTSDMDVLYEMLSSFAEDSVNIYAGLANPVTQEPAGEDDLDAELEDEPAPVVQQLHPRSEQVEPEQVQPATPAVEESDELEEPVPLEQAPQFRSEDQPRPGAPVRAVDLDAPAETPAVDQSGVVSIDQARILAYQHRTREQAEAARAATPEQDVEPGRSQPATALAEQMQEQAEDGGQEIAPRPSRAEVEPVPAEATATGEPAEDTPNSVETVPVTAGTTPVEQPASGPVVTAEGTVATQVPEPVQQEQGDEASADESTGAQRVSVTVVESRAVTVTTEETVEVPVGADDKAEQPKAPAARKPRPRKKRASVPSWDEIMFGGPSKKTD